MELSERWPLTGAFDLRDRLLAAYAEPHRRYHDVRHLAEVLDRLDELSAAGVAYDDVAVRLAAWFHDAVHDGRADDEARSAHLAAELLREVPVPDDVVSEVTRLVLLTQRHRPAEGDVNGCALSDADLAILASAPARYGQYLADVREEYAELSEADFTRGRRAVLLDLSDQATLFRTLYARARWEQAARANLARELAARSG